MLKQNAIYSCTKCGAQFPKWSGRCLECGSWSSLVEDVKISDPRAEKKDLKFSAAEVIDFSELKTVDLHRLEIGISEVDRVFGGGIALGSLILLAGEPGIGKSTLLSQIISRVSENNLTVYISGEESAGQVKDRFERLRCNLHNVKFISETNVEKTLSAVKSIKPNLVVVDSVQTVYSLDVPSEPGSITQIRAVTTKFLEYAKQNDVSVILVGHITKDGSAAGPKTLEHIVDAVVYLETDNSQNYRILRSSKNRFGSTREIGLFEMTDKGLLEVKNPSSLFLEDHLENFSGSVIGSVMEGTRPFLIEIQALVTKTLFGYPQRKASGFDLNRLQVLTAVLTKRTKINLANYDVILNVVGGLKVSDSALDLAACLAMASSLLNKPISNKTLIAGEVGLGGEIRNISRLEDRLKAAVKLGFDEMIIFNANLDMDGIKLHKIKNINEAIGLLK